MKSIVITGSDVELNNALQKAITNFEGEMEIVYSAPFSNEVVENIAFSQPDYIIADFLNEEQVRAIIDTVIRTTIVFISEDTNRTNAVISTFNKENVFSFINLDKSQINPKSVLTQLRDYNPTMFEEVDASTPISSEKVAESVEDVSNPMPIVDDMNTSPTEENTPKELEEVSNVASYKPIEEPIIAKPIDNLHDDIEKKKVGNKVMGINLCNIVTLYSKKGGTGNTTLAKEIANTFANVTLAKRLSDKEHLEVCLVDFDFEQGNLRTMLGVTNPNPNLYFLIDAILTKLEQGIPLNRIYFSEPEFKINYCIKLKTSPVYVLCLAQGDIPKRLIERMVAFGDDELFVKIIKKIIQILKNCFDLVVVDTTSSYNDVNEVIFKNSNKIVYPLEPTLADLENLKVTLDETKENNYITNKIIPVVNKAFKSRFNESFLSIFEEIQKSNPELKNIVGMANYDTQVVMYNNNYAFASFNVMQFRTVITTICQNILPIFKAKNLTSDLNAVRKKRELERKKQAQVKRKQATKEVNASLTQAQKDKTPTSPIPTPEANNDSESKDIKENNVAASFDDTMTVREYISSDLSKKDVTSFVEDLKRCSDIAFTKKGFPKLATEPKTLNKKVWKQYYKLLSKNIK